MKKVIFQSAVGAIMLLLSDKLYDFKTDKRVSFTTENEDRFFSIIFDFENRHFTIKIQNEKSDKMLIFVNTEDVGNCFEIELAIEEIKLIDAFVFKY